MSGAIQYSMDNSDFIVPGYYYYTDIGYKSQSPYTWLAYIRTYCGSNKKPVNEFCLFRNASEFPIGTCPTDPNIFGYGHNARFSSLYVGGTMGTNNNTFRKTSSIPKPSQMILLADNRYMKRVSYTTFDEWSHLLSPLDSSFYTTDYWSVIYPKHGTAGNTAYLDGHVGLVTNPVRLYSNAENNKAYFGAK